MSQTILIFITGLAGVFTGMGLLYGAIKLNTLVTEYILERREEK